MAFFPWSPDYSVGIRLIDNDHKDLVDTVNELHDAIEAREGCEAVRRALTMLAGYVREHFTREEQLMADYGYPALAAHKRLHVALRRRVHAIRLVHAEDPFRIDPAKLLDFLRDWLVNHILKSDLQYVPYMTGKDSGVKGDSQAPDRRPAEAADGMVALELQIPADKVEMLRRCAILLRKGGDRARSLEEIADPLESMTFEEALEEVAPLVRRAKGNPAPAASSAAS